MGDSEAEEKLCTRRMGQVLKRHTEGLMFIPGVVGTAQGLEGERLCIKVYVVRKSADLERKIPQEIEGFPVVVEETGAIRARAGG